MKIIITRGLPASGKTTWSKEQLENRKGQLKRVNRDDLRAMIDNGKWSKRNEKLIVHIEKLIARYAFSANCDVIIDDTNLSQKTLEMWVDFAAENNVKLEIKDFMDVPVSECVKRDQKRPNYVGEKVIKKMYHQFLAKPPANVSTENLQPCWVFDLDGTLALHDGRNPYDAELCESDIVNESVRTILNNIKQPRYVFLVSGRSEEYRPHTERWLKSNEIDYDFLYMRQKDDLRNDDIIKSEICDTYIQGKYKVVAWFDDRHRICRMIHNRGLPIFKIGDPDSDF